MDKFNQLYQLSENAMLGSVYRLKTCLGSGSYGYVWKAEKVDTDEIIALKLPKEQSGRDRDLQEGHELLGQPKHPNLISIQWMGRIPPQKELYAIEMEYFNGHTLAFLLDKEKFITSYQRLLSLYQQVLDGVEHLHGLGIAHGDIKPQNILIQGDIVKITDFGSSLTTDDLLVRTRDNGGTILYSPPEHVALASHEYDTTHLFSHDIYSLGVLLYQLLTGRLPHDTLHQVVKHIPFPKPREISKSIAPELEEVVLKALSLKPEDRWESISAMKQAFQRATQAQLFYQSRRNHTEAHIASGEDWSSVVISLFEQEKWDDAEQIASLEYEQNQNEEALLFKLRAMHNAKRFFDLQQYFYKHKAVLDQQNRVLGDIELLALSTYIQTEQFHQALDMVGRCLKRHPEQPGLLFRKAVLLGIQARYEDSAKILLLLNRRFPRRKAILEKLVLVHQQLRDFDKAGSFERVLRKI